MEEYVLTVWLTAVWYASALEWAERSGVRSNEPGWMCGVPYRPVGVWSVKR
jgi:hypothetical protein